MRVRRENTERLTTDLKNLSRDYTAKKSQQSNLPTQPRNLTSSIYLHSQEISPVQFTYTSKKSHQSNLPTQPRNLNSPIYLHSQEISTVQFTYTAKKSQQSNLPTQPRNLTSPIYLHSFVSSAFWRNEYSCIIYVVLNV
jgi:hypothetical protein